jgi:hypothetical protein
MWICMYVSITRAHAHTHRHTLHMAAHVHLLCYAADQRELLGNAVCRVLI